MISARRSVSWIVRSISGLQKRTFSVTRGFATVLVTSFLVSTASFAEDNQESLTMAQSVQKSVRSQKGQLRFCYEKRLREKPDLSGTVLMGFEVVDGGAYNVSVLRNTTGDSELERCFMDRVEAWVFSNEVDIAVEFPFQLESSLSI